MRLLIKYITMFREDMEDVMSRRCGLDELNNFLIILDIIYIVIALFSHSWILIILAFIFMILSCFRIFSKNLSKRQKENDFYMQYMGNAVKFVHYLMMYIKMKIKTYKDPEYAYFVCRSCGQIMRMPKGKAQITIRCPKCDHTYIKRT